MVYLRLWYRYWLVYFRDIRLTGSRYFAMRSTWAISGGLAIARWEVLGIGGIAREMRVGAWSFGIRDAGGDFLGQECHELASGFCAAVL